MSHRPGTGHYNSSIEINASAERIWPWLEDGERAKQWVSWLVEVRRTGPAKGGVGDKETWVLKDPNMNNQLVPVEGTCTEYVRPTRSPCGSIHQLSRAISVYPDHLCSWAHTT